MAVIGWDIGGVNTKVARIDGGIVHTALSRPFEVQRDPDALANLLARLAQEIGAAPSDAHAVTMTAELSQMFRTKRDGVGFILRAVTTAFGTSNVHVYTVDGRFLTAADAPHEPLAVAASNWAATARIVAIDHPNTILIDTGTTTTDIIPIVGGQVAALGTTDPTRLATGELVYSGALRTPVEAILQHVPFGDDLANVSAESFALVGDVHLWRGELAPDDYSVPTPDGRPATREFARERLARIVCADRDTIDDAGVSRIADAVSTAQVAQITRGLQRVHARHPSLRSAIVTGLGAFVAARVARELGLTPIALAKSLGAAAARSAPAAAVALLLERQFDAHSRGPQRHPPALPDAYGVIDAVVKIGGSQLARPVYLRSIAETIVAAAQSTRILVVPGGGAFADTVRSADATFTLGNDAAHWMAILAMDQYAHLIASLHHSFVVVDSIGEIESALATNRVPIIAPYRWLREADPLPHSWDVTSDSISAWIAGALGGDRLILVKAPGARDDDLVDPYFATALPTNLSWSTVTADSEIELRNVLDLGVRR